MKSRSVKTQLGIGGLLLAVLVGLVIVHQWLDGGTKPDPALSQLARYGKVPEFSLTERSGREVSSDDLRGTVWIANFIYTQCKDTCPTQTATLARLQHRLPNPGKAAIVSMTIDPDRDSPEALSVYADRFGADPQRWLFLTGPKHTLRGLAQGGFHLSAVPARTGEDKDLVILHSSRFVLVDGLGEIRGYYDSNDPQAMDRLLEHLRTLAKPGV